jgi:hypothetical protein
VVATVSEAAKAKAPVDKRRKRLAVLLDTLNPTLRHEIESSILEHDIVAGRRKFACRPLAIAQVLVDRNLVPADGRAITREEIIHYRITRIYHEDRQARQALR